MVRRLAINFSEVLLCLRLLFSSASWKKHTACHPSSAWHWRSSGLHVHPSSRSCCCCECQDWLQYSRKLAAGHLAELRVWLMPWVKAQVLRMEGDWGHEATGCYTKSCCVFLQFSFSDFHWWSLCLSLMGKEKKSASEITNIYKLKYELCWFIGFLTFSFALSFK